MIRTSPTTTYRAAAVVLAAAVLSVFTQRAAAQTLDLFSGTIGTPSQLSISSTLSLGTVSTSGPFGPAGYSGTVSLNGNAIDTLSEGFTPNGASNTFFISQTGVAATGGQATATRTFTNSLAPNTTYALTLTRTNTSAVGLLGSFQIALSNNSATFVNTSNGLGLAGIVDVLGIFGTTGTTATFQFTTPASYVPASGLGVSFTGNLPVNALGGTYSFTGASISQVPEPRTGAAMLVGVGGFFALHFRRRLRRA